MTCFFFFFQIIRGNYQTLNHKLCVTCWYTMFLSYVSNKSFHFDGIKKKTCFFQEQSLICRIDIAWSKQLAISLPRTLSYILNFNREAVKTLNVEFSYLHQKYNFIIRYYISRGKIFLEHYSPSQNFSVFPSYFINVFFLLEISKFFSIVIKKNIYALIEIKFLLVMKTLAENSKES